MRIIFALLLLLAVMVGFKHAYGEEITNVDTAIVFVVDCSRTMDAKERNLTRSAHARAVQSPQVLEAIAQGYFKRIAVSYVEFSDSATVRIPWMVVDTPESAALFARQLLGEPCIINQQRTNIAAGLEVAYLLLSRFLTYEADRLVIDVVGDGSDNHGTGLAEVRKFLIDYGAVINGIPMPASSGEATRLFHYYCGDRREGIEGFVAGGLGYYCETLESIEQMELQLRRKIVLEIG